MSPSTRLGPQEVNTAHVEQIVHQLGNAMEHASIPGVTTTADMLSAVFTVLSRMLRTADKLADPEDREANATEVGRILSSLLMEFGSTKVH